MNKNISVNSVKHYNMIMMTLSWRKYSK